MTFTQKQLADQAKTQSKALNMYFESIADLTLREEIVKFMMKIGEAAGIEVNHSAIKKTLQSDEVFDMMIGNKLK